MGNAARILRCLASAIVALVVAGGIPIASSEGSVAVAAAHAGVTERITGPDSSADPLRCVERVALPSVDQAIEATWAPDSRHLAVTRIATSPSGRSVTGFEEDPKLGVLDLLRGTLVDVGEGKSPQWSENGTYLSFWRKGHLHVMTGGGTVAILEPSMPEVRWVGEQLVYFARDQIRAWTEADDVVVSRVAPEYAPRYPQDWVDLSADGALFTLTRYWMDGRADRYVGEVRTGQLAPLEAAGTTYTEWSPVGETLLVRSDETVELRGAGGFHATAAVTSFPGTVHGWTADGRLLMGRVSPTVPAGVAFDRFVAWDGAATEQAALPNLLGTRAFSTDGRYFVGITRNGLYETALEVYRCGTSARMTGSRADHVARGRQQRIESDPRVFARPVMGYFSQFVQGSHTGIDVAAPLGSIITSSGDGEITYVGWRPVGGRAVCVLHDAGLESCYYHTSQALVRVGQRVARGEPVALIGMTGLTTGPHVHWEAKRGGVIVDPFRT